MARLMTLTVRAEKRGRALSAAGRPPGRAECTEYDVLRVDGELGPRHVNRRLAA